VTLGAQVVVLELGAGLQGLGRRRLLDLGFTPGAAVTVEMQGPFGEPRAYRVRQSLVALRLEQASQIKVQ